MISDSKIPTDQNNLQVPVYLNIYHFWACFNKLCEPLGIGVYHTGVQVYDYEYMFFGFDGDQTGVGFIDPYTAAYQFTEQILIGYTNLNFFELDDYVLDPLRLQFTGNKYDLLANNCNHFAKRFTKQLKLQQKFPNKIFRITDCCNLFRCCIPNCILNGRLDWLASDTSSSLMSDYMQLQQSVNNQTDLKILNQKQQKPNTKRQSLIHEQKENQRLKFIEQHPDFPKHTTLRKGIWPHTQHPHQRLSNSNVSSRFIPMGQSDQQNHQNQRKYPNERVNIYANINNEKMQDSNRFQE